jgi:hypothetical protein
VLVSRRHQDPAISMPAPLRRRCFDDDESRDRELR